MLEATDGEFISFGESFRFGVVQIVTDRVRNSRDHGSLREKYVWQQCIRDLVVDINDIALEI